MKFDTTLDRLRSIGVFEAISYLLLLGIAMPLKYVFDLPEAVRVVGMAHGILWMAYVGLAVLGQIDYKWSLKTTAWLFIASLLPFGPFLADSKLLSKVKVSPKN
jgi:integral membrane protein